MGFFVYCGIYYIMGKFIISEDEIKSIKSLYGLSEQVVQGGQGDPYEYKKEGGLYYTRKKGSPTWIKTSGKISDAISKKIFSNNQPTNNSQTKPVPTNSTNVPLNLNSTYEAIRSTDKQKYQITPKRIYTDSEDGYIGYMANIVGPGSYEGDKLTAELAAKCPGGCYDLSGEETNKIRGNTEMGEFTIIRKIK